MEIEMGKVFQTPGQSISKIQKREDHHSINELADDVLILILSHLSMKEAARTSVLSHRWEKLWTSHPCLVFDGSETLRDIHYRSKGVLESDEFKYANWVNDVLESHHAPAIDEFKVRFDLHKHYQSEVDEWVRFAFGKKVKRLELNLSSTQEMFRDSCYKLCSRTLRFQSPISLTSLILKQVSVSGEVLENLISNNPFLKCLCVGDLTSLVDLRVSGPSLCLTHLEIMSCISMQSLELDAPNLLSLKYSGQIIKIRFIKVPNHAELCFGDWYTDYTRAYILPPVPTFSPQLQKLVLTMSEFSKSKMKRFKYPVLNQLEQLDLRVSLLDHDSLLCLSSLINASPSLNRLSLELNLSKYNVKRKVKKIKSPHYNLKVVEIIGFVGQSIDTEFCMYLIENAVMLEQISIDPYNKHEKTHEIIKANRIREAREQAEQLRSKYGLGDKLLIL